MIDALDGAVVRADCAADIERAHREKRHAVIFNIQNAEPVGDQLDRVDTLYGLGMRCMQLTYNLRTRFGEALVDKLDRSRMMVDVRSTWRLGTSGTTSLQPCWSGACRSRRSSS